MENYGLPNQTEFVGDLEAQQQLVDDSAALDVQVKEEQEAQLADVEATQKAIDNKEDPRSDGVGFNLGDIGAEANICFRWWSTRCC